MQMKTFSAVGLCLIGLIFSSASVGQGNSNKPLLQEGKKSLYQRVLTTPNCKLYAKPGDQSGAAQEAFSRYYVYQKQESSGKKWIEVGIDTVGKKIGAR